MRRCTRCVLPEMYPTIEFDKDGVCNFCRNFKEIKVKGEQALLAELSPHKKHRNGANCVVPISGGRDSTFVLYVMKKLYGMQPIAVNYRDEFSAPQAQKNIKNAVDILDVELVSVSSKRSTKKRIIADTLRLAIPHGPERVANSFCTHCLMSHESVAYGVAKERNVPTIIWGDSQDEDTRLEGQGGHVHKSATFLHKVRVLCSRDALKHVRLRLNNKRMAAEFPYSTGSSHSSDSSGIHLFDYVPHEEDDIVRLLRRELKWDKPPEARFPWRFDCVLSNAVTYFARRASGYSKYDMVLSNMVRKGTLDRETALSVVSIEGETAEFEKLVPIFEELELAKKDIARLRSM